MQNNSIISFFYNSDVFVHKFIPRSLWYKEADYTDVNLEERQKNKSIRRAIGHDNIPLKSVKLDLKLDKTGNRKIFADLKK